MPRAVVCRELGPPGRLRLETFESKLLAPGQVRVAIEDPKRSARYAAMLLRGVRVGPARHPQDPLAPNPVGGADRPVVQRGHQRHAHGRGLDPPRHPVRVVGGLAQPGVVERLLVLPIRPGAVEAHVGSFVRTALHKGRSRHPDGFQTLQQLLVAPGLVQQRAQPGRPVVAEADLGLLQGHAGLGQRRLLL